MLTRQFQTVVISKMKVRSGSLGRTGRHNLGALALGVLACYLLAAPAAVRAAVGYTSRPCGLDLNANGTLGESTDCNICNGNTTFSDKRQIYVDCQSGNDTSGTGQAASPYRSIQHAMNSTSSGVQNIICFKGTCSEQNLTPQQSGVSGSYTRDGFQFPTKPNMLVGWDANNNGDYPPHDPNDVAVLEGNGFNRAVSDGPNPMSYWEFAHFTAQNYGVVATNSDSDFMWIGSSGTAQYIYVHDLALLNINRGRVMGSGQKVFNFFTNGAVVNYFAAVNLDIENFGSYGVRGAPQSGSGPWRFQNLTMRGLGASGSTVDGFKLWNELTGIDILNSLVDANPSAWSPCLSGCDPTYAIAAGQCSRNWTIRGNQFLNWKYTFAVQPDAGTGFCQTRAMDNVVFDRNVIRNTYSQWQWGTEEVKILSGSLTTATVNNVTISNNMISSTTPLDACIWSNAGNDGGPQSGTVNIVNNTCSVAMLRWGSIMIGAEGGTLPAFPQQNYVVKDNVVTGLGSGQVNIATQYAPSNLVLDGNVYDPNGGFCWNTTDPGTVTQSTLSGWRSVSGEGSAAKQCAPSFVNRSTGDFHLSSSDTCAQNGAVSVSSITSVDIDGDGRPQGTGWDAGADEVSTGSSAPPAPTLLKVTPM